MNVETTWGVIEVELADGKVVRCSLPFLSTQPEPSFAIKTAGDGSASTFITDLFSGNKTKTPAVGKFDGTDFQQQVWGAISDIPYGRTKTYGELAKSIGRPNAVRAVGSACGKNPAPLFIPCHRVVGSNGGFGGFSAGRPWKQLLLLIEHPHPDLGQQGLHR